MLPQENVSYGAFFVQMIRAIIRKRLGHQLEMQFVLTATQKESLVLLVEFLKRDVDQQTEVSAAEAMTAYHGFAWSLVYSPDYKSQKRWGNPIERFIWLMALKDDGSFIEATDLTPMLAKLKYFCREVTLYESLSSSDQTNPMEDPIQ